MRGVPLLEFETLPRSKSFLRAIKFTLYLFSILAHENGVLGNDWQNAHEPFLSRAYWSAPILDGTVYYIPHAYRNVESCPFPSLCVIFQCDWKRMLNDMLAARPFTWALVFLYSLRSFSISSNFFKHIKANACRTRVCLKKSVNSSSNKTWNVSIDCRSVESPCDPSRASCVFELELNDWLVSLLRHGDLLRSSDPCGRCFVESSTCLALSTSITEPCLKALSCWILLLT